MVTNACVLWTTTYLGDTIDALRADGIEVSDETAAHLTPAQHDHINFYGTYSFDIDAELRSTATARYAFPRNRRKSENNQIRSATKPTRSGPVR